MKKINQNTNRSQENNRKEYHSPTRFPKKQFELIYREKEHLPSSEAFESIIFMKSKKCQNKDSIKTGSKSKKQQVDSLKKVMNKLEKHLKYDRSHPNKKDEDISKSAILKNKTNLVSADKKNTNEGYKNKSSQRLNKYQKADPSRSCEKTKKYRKMVSPGKSQKHKLSQQPTASTFGKTMQESSRKQLRCKTKKSKKQTQNSFLPVFHFEEPEQYVVLQDNFVELNQKDVSVLDQKFISGRQVLSEKLSSVYDHKQQNSSDLKELIEYNQEGSEFLEEDQDEDQARRESRPNSFSHQEAASASNLSVIQNYFNSKVKIIQKWWRQILQKRAQGKNILSCNIEPIPAIELFQADTSQSIMFQEETPRKENVINSSPIKMIHDFPEQEENNGEMQLITMRQNAAKKQVDTNKDILQKMFQAKKISLEVYIERKEMIETKYFNELQEIEELKRILRKNVSRTVQLQKKAQETQALLQSQDIQVDNQFLDKIFGHENSKESHKNQLRNIPILPNGPILQREKSTGCHFNSQESSRPSMYKKDQENEEEYKEDFEEDEEESKEGNINEFFTQNPNADESMTNNFKEIFDEFKVREQVKMEIDKRAAIQMGVMVEEIPPEIKDEFVSIDTSLSSIHRFILALFKYYIFYYKFDFLRLVNMPFGYNVDKRIKMLQGYSDQEALEQDEDGVIYGLEDVIPEDIFEEFYQKVYDVSNQQLSSAKKANFEFEKIHNKAIFDSFNEALNIFRPYFIINGPPFPWTNSEKALTFYFIAEENIQEVFEKTQFKVLKWASSLCGIIVDKCSTTSPVALADNQSPETIVEKYQQSNHQLLNETRDDRIMKNEKSEVEESALAWQMFEEQKAINLIESSEFIFEQLVEEIFLQIFSPQQPEHSEKKFCEDLQHISVGSSQSEF